MTLQEYLDSTGEAPLAFGARLGLKQPGSIYRYLRGERIPTPYWMRAIYEKTQRKVSPNDWILGTHQV